MESIMKNQTWELVELPPNKPIVNCKQIYKIKEGANGNIEKYKARLVAKGYTQIARVDYEETFSSIAKLNTVRAVIALAAQKNQKIYQLDVKSAFLNGEIEEVIYMTQPEGYTEKGQEHLVCRLKQAPRAWYTKLDNYLCQNGFHRCNSDSSLYVKNRNGLTTIIIVYVDDMILTGDDDESISNIKSQLESKFEMTDLGLLNYYLGIEIDQKVTQSL